MNKQELEVQLEEIRREESKGYYCDCYPKKVLVEAEKRGIIVGHHSYIDSMYSGYTVIDVADEYAFGFYYQRTYTALIKEYFKVKLRWTKAEESKPYFIVGERRMYLDEFCN